MNGFSCAGAIIQGIHSNISDSYEGSQILDQNEQIGIGERLWIMRRPLQFVTDVAILAAAFIVAYLPAINIQLSDFYLNTALTQVSFVVLVEISVLFLLGAYSIIWRYISVSDVRVFVFAGLISGTILAALRFALGFTDFDLWRVPLSVIFIQTVIGYGGLLAVRVLRRLVYESREKNKFGSTKKKTRRSRVLLVGAGRTGAASRDPRAW